MRALFPSSTHIFFLFLYSFFSSVLPPSFPRPTPRDPGQIWWHTDPNQATSMRLIASSERTCHSATRRHLARGAGCPAATRSSLLHMLDGQIDSSLLRFCPPVCCWEQESTGCSAGFVSGTNKIIFETIDNIILALSPIRPQSLVMGSTKSPNTCGIHIR